MISCVIESLEQRRLFHAGDLDSTFGRGGAAALNPLTLDGQTVPGANAVAIQTDGKVIVGGDEYITRYLADGRTDTTFGTDGVISAGATDLAIQPDGKIVALSSRPANFTVVRRFTSDGALDPTFNGGGATTLSSVQVTLESIALDPSTGKIVVAGQATDDGTTFHAEVVRLTTSGALDNTFGTGGFVEVEFSGNSAANAVLVQPDGRIVFGGATTGSDGGDFAFARLNTDGDLDPTFGTGGKTLIDFDGQADGASSIAFGPGGTIVAVGSATITTTDSGLDFTASDFALVQLTAAGQLDSSFGGGTGKVHSNDGSPVPLYDAWQSVSVLSSGEIVTAGTSFYTFTTSLVDGRYRADGTPETDSWTYRDYNGDLERYNDMAVGADGSIARVGTLDFQYVSGFGPNAPEQLVPPPLVNHEGPGGVWSVIGRSPGFAGSFSVARAQADGKIVAGGFALTLLDLDSYVYRSAPVARFNADGTLDASFGDGGVARLLGIPDGDASTGGIADIQMLADGRIMVLTAGQRDGADPDFLVMRLLSTGAPDVSFGDHGAMAITFGSNDTPQHMVIGADGSILVAGYSYNADYSATTVDLARLTPNGFLDSSFGHAGREVQSFERTVAVVGGFALDGAGRPVLGLTLDAFTDGSRTGLARYTANGLPDNTFGGGANFVAGMNHAEIDGLALTADGKIVVGGAQLTQNGEPPAALYATRFTSSGGLDSTFGTGGLTSLTVAGLASSAGMVLQSDGKILLAGSAGLGLFQQQAPGSGSTVLARLDADGQSDSSFGTAGISQPLAAGVPSIAAITVDANDRAILTGGLRPESWSSVLNDNMFPLIERFTDTSAGGAASGTFYRDLNQNGRQDSGEPALVSWTAYIDTNLNGLIDPGEPSAVTDADGGYSINGLQPGPHRVREVRQDGWTRTQPAGVYPLGYYDITIVEGQKSNGNDFGNFLAVSSPIPAPTPTPTPTPTTGTLNGEVLSAFPASFIAGTKASVRVSVRLTNNSNQAVSGPATVRLYLSTNSTVEAADSLLANSRSNVKLAVGQSKVITLKVRAVPAIHAATYRLLVQTIDPSQQANVDIGPSVTLVAPFVDLAIAYAAPPAASLARGVRSTTTIQLTDVGNINVRGNATVTLRAVAVGASDAGTVIATARLHLNLKRDGTKTYKIKFLLPANLAAGNYQLTASVAAPALTDRDPTNNTATSESVNVA